MRSGAFGLANHILVAAGDGNDVLLDGDGVRNAAGGAGNDLFTLGQPLILIR